MFKRVERKRKKREEEQELLDDATREYLGPNDTDSDESGSSSASEEGSGDDTEHDADKEGEGDEDLDQDGDAASEGEEIDEEPPITVAEASKDPLYLISLDPTIHGCVLCKGKLIKNAGMAAAHKKANAHERRLERFRKLAADADSQSDAWVLVRTMRSASNFQRSESQELSKRALKRQAKQASIREKRTRHRELKAKAIAKKAVKKLAMNDKASRSSSPENPLNPPHSQPGNPRKKQKLEQKASTGEIKLTEKVKTNVSSSVRVSTGGMPAGKSRAHPFIKRARKTDQIPS